MFKGSSTKSNELKLGTESVNFPAFHYLKYTDVTEEQTH